MTNFALQASGSVAGPSVTLSWTAPAPTVTTGAATAVAGTSATMTGTVAPNGYQITDCHFVLTPAPATGSTVPCAQQLGAGTAAQPVTAAAAGLIRRPPTPRPWSRAGSRGSRPASRCRSAPSPRGHRGSTGAPLVSGLKLSRRAFPPRHAQAAAARRGISGTTISFGLSEAAPVRLTFERALAGRRRAPLRGSPRARPSAAGCHAVHECGRLGAAPPMPEPAASASKACSTTAARWRRNLPANARRGGLDGCRRFDPAG